MNNVGIPTPTPMPETYTQELLLLQQIQQHLMSTHQASILLIVLGLPLPISWRLWLYHFLVALPLPSLSPLGFLLLVTLGPILTLIFLYALVLFVLKLTRILVSFLTNATRKEQAKKVFLELTFPSNTEKSAYATEQLYSLLHALAKQKGMLASFLREKKEYSLEIVSTKNEGIRYILVADEKSTDIIKRSLLSYLPGIKVKEINDYLSEDLDKLEDNTTGIVELKLSKHFALPLKTQKQLSQHDPISYLTGNMTRLNEKELISFQVVTTPVLSGSHPKPVSQMRRLRYLMYKGEPLTSFLQKNPFEKIVELSIISIIWLPIKGLLKIFKYAFLFMISIPSLLVDTNGKSVPILQSQPQVIPQQLLNPYELELKTVVKDKIDQPLFETTIRILVSVRDGEELELRLSGLLASFGPMSSAYQSLTTDSNLPFISSFKRRFKRFKERRLSANLGQNLLLSTSEISDLFHFPYTNTTKTEDMLKSLSPDFPAPLSLKTNRKLDAIFAKNHYGNLTTDIGLTDEERAKHVYLLGKTGSGKSTVIFHMAKEDIQKGRGVAVIDPHGDLAEDLLSIVPKNRINDLIYLNPFDLQYPIGINLLELPDNLTGDELELEKELVAESVISIFRRIFSKEEYVNAHRIEYILRNTIYTSFAVPDRTLFTIYNLLNDKSFRNKVVNTLDDETLKNFWKDEFGKAGAYQAVKMAAGVTAKVGRFLFSPTARRIIEQEKSTIDFNKILNEGKILICNLSEGKIGEDTAQVLGLMVLAKIHQAALRRAREDAISRRPFYLFVDEFQNFATTSFTRILSGGRKFGLRLTLAEQSTSQQQDRSVVNVILANTGTVICFATSSPIDEQMMAPQFTPNITKEDLANLPRFKFYIKMSATNPEEPFSGETMPIQIKKDKQLIQRLVEASRKNYATLYTGPKTQTKAAKTGNKNASIKKLAKNQKR